MPPATHTVSRRELLAAAGSLLLGNRVGAAKPADSSLLLASGGEAVKMKEAARRGRSAILDKLAGEALKAGPFSVTFHRPGGGTEAGPNDYFSEGPYWWPDPRNPNGPYIRRDGRRNPARFMANRRDLQTMCDAVLALGCGAYLLDKPGCAAHAGEILSVWFVDPKTRMNPNLEFGQAIRGVTAGRGTGIIDTVSLIHAVQGIMLLEAGSAIDANLLGALRQWFSKYLAWMSGSAKGRDEEKSGNNHATWWTAQAAAYATLTRDAAALRLAWDRYRDYLVPTEIRPDGSCPREESRTNSLSYSAMNLDAFAVLCRIGQMHGVDLWHFKTAQGGSVEKAFLYLAPYLLHPETWRKQQIDVYKPDAVVFPALAGMGLPSRELLAVYDRLPRQAGAWVQWVDLLRWCG